MNVQNGGGTSYVIIEQTAWSEHPWLSRLESGSNLDLDRAFIFIDQPQEVVAELKRIVLEFQLPGSDEWISAGDGGSSPWASWRGIADAAWYRPSAWGDGPTDAWRALIPIDSPLLG